MPQAKILVIDDDIGMTELLGLLLTPTDATILIANSGKEGLELIQREAPDMVILDLMMPEINGWSVCKQIRATSNVPILILSAMDAPGMVAQALDVGADDFLTKPVSSTTLIAHINKLIRRAKVTQSLKSPTQQE